MLRLGIVCGVYACQGVQLLIVVVVNLRIGLQEGVALADQVLPATLAVGWCRSRLHLLNRRGSIRALSLPAFPHLVQHEYQQP